MARFALQTRRLLGPDAVAPGVVIVDGERVIAVADDPPAGVPCEDLGDALLARALVDTHVHVNEPGRTEWEGFQTATRSAAAGGICRLVDMPLNSDPVTTSLSAFEAKLAATTGKLWVDVGFWGGVVPGNQGELAPMIQAGVAGFKCFLCHSGIDDFPASDEPTLQRAMPILRDGGVPLLVHAELESDVREALASESPRSYLRYLHSRPKTWEDRAIAMMIDLCRSTRCPVHIVHLSSATALPLIRAAKAEGLPFTVETCPHYLCLVAEEVPDGATEFKCAPPIRESENREALWRALADGTIDFVISDHSPCIPALKLPEEGNFLDAWGGIASLQLGLRAVWTEARARGFTESDVLRWMSCGPRKLVGLDPTLPIRPGQPADLVAWRPERDQVVDPARLEHRHPVTPYAGRTLAGVVDGTWVRGHRVVADGHVVGPPVGRAVVTLDPARRRGLGEGR